MHACTVSVMENEQSFDRFRNAYYVIALNKTTSYGVLNNLSKLLLAPP